MIKTLIFDFGDVFINLDKQATIASIWSRYPDFKLNSQIEEINNQYETGHISTTDFVNFYCSYFKTTNGLFLIEAWNSIILDFPQNRMRFIEDLRQQEQFQLILLSNTNALHIERVKENMTIERYQQFKSCFDVFYLSHEIGFRKPDANIFKFVLNQNNLMANECFYVDDTLEHINSANQLGINTWHLNTEEDEITDLFIKFKHFF